MIQCHYAIAWEGNRRMKLSQETCLYKTDLSFLRGLRSGDVTISISNVSISGYLFLEIAFLYYEKRDPMKLYTKTICPKCLWVKSELQRARLEVDIINIDQDEQAKQRIMDAGFLSVPVLELEGRFIGDVKEVISQIEMISQ